MQKNGKKQCRFGFLFDFLGPLSIKPDFDVKMRQNGALY
jgi:hypothetical protein